MFDDVLGDSALKVPNSEGQWNAEHCDGNACWTLLGNQLQWDQT